MDSRIYYCNFLVARSLDCHVSVFSISEHSIVHLYQGNIYFVREVAMGKVWIMNKNYSQHPRTVCRNIGKRREDSMIKIRGGTQEPCSHVSFLQNDIYTPVPCVRSLVENRFCPELTRCCSDVWYRPAGANLFFDGLVMAEWLRGWLQQWAANGVSKILGSLVQHWHPSHEAIRS